MVQVYDCTMILCFASFPKPRYFILTLINTLYINHLDKGIEGFVARFADDTKIGEDAGNVGEAMSLQKDLLSLGEWAMNWQMES